MAPLVDFAEALSMIRQGKRVTRTGWKNAAYVFLVPGSMFVVNKAPLDMFFPMGTNVQYRPHIDMVGTDGLVGTWTPSSVDLFADDWMEFSATAGAQVQNTETATDTEAGSEAA